jgi:tetratricopeptide (TPR) repeat protein
MIAPFLLGALAIVLMLAYWRPGAGVVVAILLLLLLPGRWWRWKTRRFHRGLRALKGGAASEARTEFEQFLSEFEGEPRLDRWQPVFNLGRRYSYGGAAHANIGVTWLHEGEPDKALRHFEIARRLDETSAQAAFGEAAARRRLGQLRKAEKAAERATELRPSYLPARLLLAEIRRARGDEEGAAEVLRPLAEDGRDPDSLIQEMLSQWPESADKEEPR